MTVHVYSMQPALYIVQVALYIVQVHGRQGMEKVYSWEKTTAARAFGYLQELFINGDDEGKRTRRCRSFGNFGRKISITDMKSCKGNCQHVRELQLSRRISRQGHRDIPQAATGVHLLPGEKRPSGHTSDSYRSSSTPR